MSNLDKYKAMGAQAAAEGVDMTKAKAGGGKDFDAPAAGPTTVRLVGYVEVGKQKGSFKGAPTIKEKVWLTFELCGAKHPPHELDDGSKVPQRITIEENLSLNGKARFFKLFNRMNYAGGATHMVQLLGEAWKATVIHRKYAKRGEDKMKPETWTGIAAELYDKATESYTIAPPRAAIIDPDSGEETGEFQVIKVRPALTEPKGFLWNYSDLEDWNKLYIEGEYPERKDDKGNVTAPAKSKNVYQNAIKLATNFKDSPIYAILAAKGEKLDLPDPESGKLEGADDEGDDLPVPGREEAKAKPVPTGAAADDALNGVVE